MKFTGYYRRIHGETAFVNVGRSVDMDLEGGLEEVLNEIIVKGSKRIVLTLGNMKFFHYTLFAGLLAIQKKLADIGGDLILAEVPWFVERTLVDLDVIGRFAIVPTALTVERAERMRIDLDVVNKKKNIIPG
jgi:STAS domain-containing protein